jgi:hypothetical protein
MATSSLLKASGLHDFNNYLSAVPEGALLVAENVVIDRTGVIEPRRGITQYGELGSLNTDTAKQLLLYKDRILAHYGDKIAWDNGNGVFTDYSASFVEAATGLRIKSFESNGNLYVTTSTGIRKIAANSQAMLGSAVISDAGGVRALTGTGRCNYNDPGFLVGYSKVGYRITWGTKDVNDNFIEGAPSPVIEVVNQSAQSCTVDLTFQVPSQVNTNYFFRIYRTSVFEAGSFANLDSTVINDELRLVIEEGYVSGTQITVNDLTPSDFRDSGPPLYTNEFSGEGILQSNTAPPFAKDATLYKNYAIYANTRTKHNTLITMLGTGKFTSFGALEDEVDITNISYSAPDTTITFSAPHGITAGQDVVVFSSGSALLDGVHEVKSVTPTEIVIEVDGTGAVATNATLHSTYMDITKSPNPATRYYFVGRKEINRLTFADNSVANYPDGSYFIISSAENDIEYVVWFDRTGTTTAPDNSETAGRVLIKVNISSISNGGGTASLIASAVLDAITTSTFDFDLEQPTNTQIDIATAKSGTSNNPVTATLVAAPGVTSVNRQEGYGEDSANRYVRIAKYISPGLSIDDTTRSLVKVINDNTAEYVNAYYIFNPAGLPGQFQLESKILDNTPFTVVVNNDDVGSIFNPNLSTPTTSTNEERRNRLYYSKQFQPEAVPIVNFIDIGPKDKAIERVVALRDSLFIFKEEAIYRLTGDVPSNFFITIHDNSANILAPDAATVLNNQVFVFTTQGVVQVSETGVSVLSRPVEATLLSVTAPRFTNTKSIAFAAAYEQDRAFLLWLPESSEDTYAKVCYRYNTFTNTWTSWTVGAKCAIVNPQINRLYVGAGDDNIVERERKDLNRKDYADRIYTTQIVSGSYSGTGNVVGVGSVTNIERGDTLVQTQYLTISQLKRLATRLGVDPGMPVLARPFYTNFTVPVGSNLTSKLTDLTLQINADLGTNYPTSYSSVPETLQQEFNALVANLNANLTLAFSGYATSDGTIEYEVLVQSVDRGDNTVTALSVPPLVEGDIVIHKAISSKVVYAPLSFGDPAMLKHVRAGTVMFASADLAFAQVGYSTDLSPDFDNIDFLLEGDGSWGVFFYSSTTWGGEGTQRPFRTLIPRRKQRCRFMRTRFTHSTAFYKYQIYGISFDYEITNSRAYR